MSPALRGSVVLAIVLAIVLAAVAEAGGPEVSRTCSTFDSVSSSFDGVIIEGGSKDVISEAGGVIGGSSRMSSTGIGGGKAVISGSAGVGGKTIASSTEASYVGAI